MKTMRAIIKSENGPVLRTVNAPAPKDHEVLIRVAVAGVCRTDIYAAMGRIPVKDSLILGHEFAGTISAVGPEVSEALIGKRVTANPILPCGTCPECARGDYVVCRANSMLGIDRPGAFAEFVTVPAQVLHELPATMPFSVGAYCEPVSAALAVLSSGIKPGQRGAIFGNNRLGALVQRILIWKGFEELPLLESSADLIEANSLDFGIEASATTATLSALTKAVRPRGLIVLKSRNYGTAGLCPLDAVKKELTIKAVHYGAFAEAMQFLAECGDSIVDLIGEAFSLEEYAIPFTSGLKDETRKSFFVVEG